MILRNQRGSALLAVLWMSVILVFVAMALAATVRSEVESTQSLAQGEQGYFLARAGIEAALLRMISPPADPKQAEAEMYHREYSFQFETGSARVEFQPSTALYNVNRAEMPMLAALFFQLGMSAAEAETLARQVIAYRQPPAPAPPHWIDSLEELLTLPAMTPNLYYGGFVNGRRRPPLYQVLGAFGSSTGVNANYACPELMAVLPGMNGSLADALVAARPIRALDRRMQQSGLMFYGDGAAFTLIAHGRAAGADFERAVRATFARDAKRPLSVRLMEWNDRD